MAHGCGFMCRLAAGYNAINSKTQASQLEMCTRKALEAESSSAGLSTRLVIRAHSPSLAHALGSLMLSK